MDTSAWLFTRDGAARVTMPLNTVHASMPANENTKYGTPSLDRSAICPNTTEKMPALSSGCSTTQITPSAVCR